MKFFPSGIKISRVATLRNVWKPQNNILYQRDEVLPWTINSDLAWLHILEANMFLSYPFKSADTSAVLLPLTKVVEKLLANIQKVTLLLLITIQQ